MSVVLTESSTQLLRYYRSRCVHAFAIFFPLRSLVRHPRVDQSLRRWAMDVHSCHRDIFIQVIAHIIKFEIMIIQQKLILVFCQLSLHTVPILSYQC
jgi:hypothetical protein